MLSDTYTSMSGRSIIVAKLSKNLGIAILVFLWLTLGCFAAGLAGNVWIILKIANKKTNNSGVVDVTYGLWKNCTTDSKQRLCTQRKLTEFLSFTNITGTDPIIICLLISAAFVLLTVFVMSVMLCCCRRKPRLWRRSVKWNVVFLVIAVTASIDAMLYTELSFFSGYPGMIGTEWYNGRGWSYMVSWAGTGCVLLAFVLTLSQLCAKHEDVDMDCSR